MYCKCTFGCAHMCSYDYMHIAKYVCKVFKYMYCLNDRLLCQFSHSIIYHFLMKNASCIRKNICLKYQNVKNAKRKKDVRQNM